MTRYPWCLMNEQQTNNAVPRRGGMESPSHCGQRAKYHKKANDSTTHSDPKLRLASHDAERIFDFVPGRIQGRGLDAHHREERAKAEQQSSDNYKENHAIPTPFFVSVYYRPRPSSRGETMPKKSLNIDLTAVEKMSHVPTAQKMNGADRRSPSAPARIIVLPPTIYWREAPHHMEG